MFGDVKIRTEEETPLALVTAGEAPPPRRQFTRPSGSSPGAADAPVKAGCLWAPRLDSDRAGAG